MMKTNLFIAMLLVTPLAFGTQVEIFFKDSGGREHISISYAPSQMKIEKNTNRDGGNFYVGQLECKRCRTSEAKILEYVSTKNPEMWVPQTLEFGSIFDDNQVFLVNGKEIPYLSEVHIQLRFEIQYDLSNPSIKPVDAYEVIEIVCGESRVLSVSTYKNGKESMKDESVEKFCGRRNGRKVCDWKSNLIYQTER